MIGTWDNEVFIVGVKCVLFNSFFFYVRVNVCVSCVCVVQKSQGSDVAHVHGVVGAQAATRTATPTAPPHQYHVSPPHYCCSNHSKNSQVKFSESQ